MLKKLKQTRKAFNIYAIIAGIAMMAVTSAVVVPSAQNYYIKKRVEDSVAKERLLKDIYENYFTVDNTIADADDLVKRAIEKGILPSSASDAEFLSNGFGGKFVITIEQNPKRFKIEHNIDPDNVFALKAYEGLTSSNNGLTELKNGIQSYTYVELDNKNIQDRINKDIIQKKAIKDDLNSTSNQTSKNHISKEDSNLSINQVEGKEWWDYNADTNMFAIKTWDSTTGTWETTGWRTTDGKGADGKYYVDNLGDKKADEVVSGTRVVVQEDGVPVEYVAINGAWTKESAIESEFATVPSDVGRFKDMLDRQSSKNYFNARDGSISNVADVWGKEVKFTKTPAYWISDSTSIPHFTKTANATMDIERTIYLADNLNWLNDGNFTHGDVAFLRKNNDYKAGYKGIKESNNARGRLYPEAVYYNVPPTVGKWIYYAPTIGDVLRLGFDEGEYYTQDIAKVLYLGGYDDRGDGFRWWSDVISSNTGKNRSVIATQGDRIHFPNIGSAIYNNASLYISANIGNIELNPTYSRSGAKSIYKYDIANLFYEWGFVDGRDSEITNFLSDVVEGQEIVVNSVTSGNQSEQQILQLVPSYNDNKGKILIVYSGESAKSDRDIFGKIYDGDGKILVEEFAINNRKIGAQTNPQVTLLGDNNFAVTWQSDGDIRARVFTPEGDFIAGDDTIIDDTNQTSSNPQIATLLNGERFVIAWESDSDIKASVYSYAGLEYKAPFLVNLSNQTGPQTNPKIIVAPYINEARLRVDKLDDPNTCIIVWEDKNTNSISANLYQSNNFTLKHEKTAIAGKTDISNLSVSFSYDWDFMYHITAQAGANEVFVHTYNMKNNKTVTILKENLITKVGTNPSFTYVPIKSNEFHRHVLAYENGNNIYQVIYKYDRHNDIFNNPAPTQINTKSAYSSYSASNPTVTYIMSNVYAVTWEVNGVDGSGKGVVSKVMRTTYKDTEGDHKKKYHIPDEFLLNNRQKNGDQLNVRVASIQDYSAGQDGTRAVATFRYIAITWDGHNTDTNSTKVSARFYNISNYRWLEEHN